MPCLAAMLSAGGMYCQVGMAADNPVISFLNYKMFLSKHQMKFLHVKVVHM